MHNIIKLYYRYLLSKEVCIILLAILTLFTSGILYSSGIFEGTKTMTMYLSSYQEFFILDYLMITKLISLVLSVLLVIVLYTETSQNLRVFVIDSHSNKYLFYLLKGLFSLLVTVIITIILVSIFVIIYNIFTPYFYDTKMFFDLLISLLIQNIYYVFLTHLLISLLPNIIVGFLPIVLFWYVEINFFTMIEEGSNITKSILSVIPSISLILGEIKLYNDIPIYLLVITIFFMSYLSINLRKDIT